jgi:transposase
MSLQPELDYIVPEKTTRVARAAFPQGTLCMKIYDQLGTIFEDQDFKDIFPSQGQPAASPFRLALVTILQFLEVLSDRAAANAVRARIDWKYLLCLELDDAGFDFSVLSEFRTRLLENGKERFLLEKLLLLLREKKLVKARGKQRTDSTHVLAAIRNLNRLERVGETLRAALNALATVVPEWVRNKIPAEWVERYGRRVEDYRLPESEKQRAEYADQVGVDGHHLLDTIYADKEYQWLRRIPAIETLRKVWLYNYQFVDNVVRLRDKDNVPPSSIQIDSPYDTDAHYGRKRSTTWVGYKVHITESCDEGMPEVITNVHTEESLAADNDALPEIHESLSAVQLLPATHLVDGGYVEAKRLFESNRDYDIDLFGPARGNRFWQSQQGNGFDISHFNVDWERQIVTCPEGKTSNTWKLQQDSRGNEVIQATFAKSDCSVCPSLEQCTTAKLKRRHVNFKPKDLYEALQQARAREKTEEFKQEYKKRSGIEATISQGVRAFGLRHARYIGIVKTHLQHLATAAAINLERVYAWFEGHTPAQTRLSAFTRVMQALPV